MLYAGSLEDSDTRLSPVVAVHVGVLLWYSVLFRTTPGYYGIVSLGQIVTPFGNYEAIANGWATRWMLLPDWWKVSTRCTGAYDWLS